MAVVFSRQQIQLPVRLVVLLSIFAEHVGSRRPYQKARQNCDDTFLLEISDFLPRPTEKILLRLYFTYNIQVPGTTPHDVSFGVTVGVKFYLVLVRSSNTPILTPNDGPHVQLTGYLQASEVVLWNRTRVRRLYNTSGNRVRTTRFVSNKITVASLLLKRQFPNHGQFNCATMGIHRSGVASTLEIEDRGRHSVTMQL